MSDLVSIIMPCYNTATYVKDAIDSVINQTYSNWELIIVDDHSSDSSVDIINEFHDNRIVLLINERNQGAAFCRNRALHYAKGRWIAFLDSDDKWVDIKLEKQIEFMEMNNYSLSYTNYSLIDQSGNKLGIFVTGPKKINSVLMHLYCWPGCLTVMFDRNHLNLPIIPLIEKNNDYAMWLRLSNDAVCYLLDMNLALYRKGRANSISNHNRLTLIKWHYLLFRRCESYGIIRSLVSTVLNMVFGLIKKILFEKKEVFE